MTITGSPGKKGDTCLLVSAIENRLKKKGDLDFRYKYIKDCGLEFCRGCLLCMKRGEYACPVNDGAAELGRERMAAAPVCISLLAMKLRLGSAMFRSILHEPMQSYRRRRRHEHC